MSNKIKKSIAAILSAAMAVNLAAASVFVNAESTKYEFEDGTLTGCTVQEPGTERYQEGASGDKFVFLENSGEIAAVTVPVETTGMYNVTLHYAAPFGDKIHNLIVNDVDQGQISCAETGAGEWADVACGSVKLNAGDNTIAIKSNWGWTDIDYITIEETVLPEIKATDTICADPNIIPEAQNLMNYMASIYGNHILSGQQEIYLYGPHDFEYEFNYIEDTTGELPAIRAFDYLNEANILYGSPNDGTTDRMIDWVENKGGIITASWHVTVPKDFENFELGTTQVDWSQATYKPDETDFDTSKILEEGSKEREYWMACLDKLAESIQKLEDRNIPLIFRPLHEAEGSGGENGSWFFWGQDGSAVYKELWILTYNTLVNDYDLHNIIWEWNSYNYETSADWYPGDDYVDIIAYDKYNCTDWSTGSPVLVHNDSAISSTFYGIMEKYDSKKMVAMSENDSIPALENILAEKAGWLYFCPWYDGGSDDTNFLSNPIFNTKEDLITMYQSDYCITLDELPDDLYTNGDIVTTTTTEGGDVTGTTTTTTSKQITTTTTTYADEGNEVNADVEQDGSNYLFSFDEAIGDKLYIDFTTDSTVTFANGCVGISVILDGVDYWTTYQWQISGDGTITVDISNPTDISYNEGADKVTDEALIAQIAEEAMANNSGMVQIWWVNDGAGEQMDNSAVVPEKIYILSKGDVTTGSAETTTTATETTESSETTTTTTTATETTESSNTTTTTATETTESSGSTTTTTTVVIPSDVKYGDVNLDDAISMLDLVMMNKYNAKVIQFNDNQKANAECCVDGVINSSDSRALLQFLVLAVESLPVQL